MAVPARPVSGVPIESAWGQVAHDTAVAMDVQAGDIAVAVNAAVSGTAQVVFPRPFASPPIVVACYRDTNTAYIAFVNGAPTATACSVGLTSKTAGATFTDTRRVAWIAYGPRA
jgi:hypothetical protein